MGSPKLASLVNTRTKRLDVTHGFHSVFTEPILPELDSVAKTLAWHEPSIHVELCTDELSEERLGLHVVLEHARRPVFFANAIERLSKSLGDKTVWLEAGMRTSALSLVRSTLLSKLEEHLFFPSPLESDKQDPGSRLSELTVTLWNEGLELQHWVYHRCEQYSHQPVHLPPYQFDKSKHWLLFQRSPQAIDPPGVINSAVDVNTHAVDFCSFSESLSSVKDNTFVFVTNPSNRRFKTLVEHHIVFGQALVPLALYLELPSRAVLTLVPSANYQEYVCRVELLEIERPIGLDVNRVVLTTMMALPGQTMPGYTRCLVVRGRAAAARPRSPTRWEKPTYKDGTKTSWSHPSDKWVIVFERLTSAVSPYLPQRTPTNPKETRSTEQRILTTARPCTTVSR